MTPEQARRFQLVDNAPEGMAGAWDIDLLEADFDLPELMDLGFDFSIFELTDGPDVLESEGNLSGSQYGLTSSKTSVPFNILGIGGLVDREIIERVREKLLNDGAIEGEDNGEILKQMFLSILEE